MSRNRRLYTIRFQERSGSNGGYGRPKAFRTTARSGRDAARKLHKRGARIIAIRASK